ncbi:MAG TPA: glycosyltransferase [Burkholderiales bacterium]|nr:glycosyltransferase [Burkholderiales bacterium]HTT19197.1 glycosyltransferase [Candidatus Sulfotelmatobacter sp.]
MQDKNNLKVLHLVPSLAGGGAEKQLALLATQLVRLKVEIHLGFVHSGANAGLALASNATLHTIPRWGNHNPAILVCIIALIRRIRPHIVQTWLHQMDILGGLAAQICRVPQVLSERSSKLAYPDTWKNRSRAWVGRRATAIVANSQGGIDYWTPRIGQETSLHLIRNGLPLADMDEIAPLRPDESGLADDSEIVLFAGRLNPEKNLFVLVDALDLVLQRHPNAAAILFGEGPLRREIEKRITRSPFSDRYHLRGYTQDLWRWIRLARVVVSISCFEGNPNIVLEAMALGCPLVVSDIPQHREILDDSMASFCTEGSPLNTATAISETLADRGRAAARAENARCRVQGWSVEESALQYLGLYQTLVSNKWQ